MTTCKRLAALLLAVALALTGGCAALAAEQAQRTVRVGFFAFEGYHHQDANGERSGYGYEYLQQMARYTGWKYEYVGYEKSWSDMQKMLENGEIDLLTSAQKTEEREKIFDFSTDPIGYSCTLLTIKAGNVKYTIDNFSTFEGIRVGMIEGNSRNQDFAEFAAEKGFGYVPVMFGDTDSLVRALQSENIDAIVTSSLRATSGEWIVAQFSFSPYYVCVKKGNAELLRQVNEALDRLAQDQPSLQNELNSKYYASESGDEVAFTEQERRYIEAFQQSGQQLRVMINPDRSPLAFYDEAGAPSGLFGDVAEAVLRRAGLPYTFVQPKDRKEYAALRESHQVDLCMDMRFDYNQAEREGYRQTDSYYTASISRVTRDGFTGDVRSVAAIANSDIATNLMNGVFSGAETTYYPTMADCIAAVRDGRQDATYLYTYVAEEMLRQSELTHLLTATLVPDFTTQFCVGVGNPASVTLFTILNKCVASLDRGWLDQRTMLYTRSDHANVSLRELIYQNPIAAIALIGVLLMLAAAVALLLVRQSARRRDEQQAREIQRLFSYVCGANELVMEVNLNTMQAREYRLENGALCTRERPYRTEDNFRQFMQPEDYQAVTARLNLKGLDKLIRTGGELVFVARARGVDGLYRWYIYTLHGMKPDAVHPRSFMLFKRDINALKLKEEESRAALTDALSVAQEASAAKGSFMSRMSHEIRTPLNAVIGYLTLANDCLQEPAKVGGYIDKCQSAARHLLSIINDVLDISAIESGKIKIAAEPFDLKEQLSSLSLMFYNQAKAKGVQFDVEIRDMAQERVVGDSLRLNQILMNLLSNALKFTPEGGSVRLVVTQLPQEDARVRCRFEISDTGIGMNKEFMKRIFSPFEQEKMETTRKYGGSGLGLSITHNLVTMMQGSIAVDSEEGKGSTFTVHLVFKTAPQAGHAAAPADFSKLRALIVDDERRSCDSMQALLKRCKVKSDVALSGEEAVRQIVKREGTGYEYDLCLIDWNMPGLDGVETARRIRQCSTRDMPIIIASAYDVNEIRDAATAAGVNRLIAKPLFQSSLFDLLVDTFGKYEPETAAQTEEQPADFAGMRVMLAEDNEMNREIAVTILRKNGILVDTATNGQEAVDRFTGAPAGTYKVILMDVQMPVMDGYEATRAIRASGHPQAKTIPILAMTANAFTEDVTAALASGMNDHIAKPINYDKLYRLLRQYGGLENGGKV